MVVLVLELMQYAMPSGAMRLQQAPVKALWGERGHQGDSETVLVGPKLRNIEGQGVGGRRGV